jgi:hypothetical protein
MANIKISALSASTTPLAGTEVLPIVQSGSTVKVSVADLTAGRAISATSVTASTGNFVVGTSGQGIDFSATPGTGTSELLNDYEEGAWTPVITADTTNPTVTYTTQSGTYTKVGRLVYVSCNIVINTVAGGSGNVIITGLPFIAGAIAGLTNAFVFNFLVNPQQYFVPSGSNVIFLYTSTFTNTTTTTANLQAGAFLRLSGTYSI